MIDDNFMSMLLMAIILLCYIYWYMRYYDPDISKSVRELKVANNEINRQKKLMSNT